MKERITSMPTETANAYRVPRRKKATSTGTATKSMDIPQGALGLGNSSRIPTMAMKRATRGMWNALVLAPRTEEHQREEEEVTQFILCYSKKLH